MRRYRAPAQSGTPRRVLGSWLLRKDGAWPASASANERIEALRQHLLEVEGRLTDVRRQVHDETFARRQSIAELEGKLQAQLEQLQQSILGRDQQSARIDARGLPVIAAGIVLSGLSKELADFLYPLGWLWVIIAVTVSAAVSISARREDRALQPLAQ